jgi:hypothetical protein
MRVSAVMLLIGLGATLGAILHYTLLSLVFFVFGSYVTGKKIL